jgi:acyl-CoA reductase-like NAD-dependent aldehyde dehydrogenase
LFEAHLHINGRPVPSPAGATYDRRDPVSDRVVTRAAAGSEDDALAAADAAAGAFAAWAATPPDTRAEVLLAADGIFAARTDDVVAIAARELGSSEEWTRFNVGIARQILRQAATLCDGIGETEETGGPPGLDYRLSRRPAGVVLGIAPWNAAVTLATRAVAAPLACGNTVVLKGSELCPKTHEWVVRCLCDAGLPPGVLNYVTNAPERASSVVTSLIAHAAVRRVNFTGSTRVGREIAVEAARHLKRCLLELSGKGTMIVLAGADLDRAAEAAAHGAFFNQGQICMSTERIVVEESVADVFVDRLVAATRPLRFDRETGRSPLGALVSAQAPLRIRGLIEDAVEKGATLVAGGEVQGTCIQPAILDHVAPGMRIYSEEAFGPIAAVVRVGDAEEALSVGNDTEFGLVAAVFDRDAERALGLARSLDCGIVHVNGPTVYDDPTMPFGGLKASGYGRFGGRAALEEFTEIQWITVREEEDGAARIG